jgi:glyoxylase-like metal-dependent hydrolase (beta-lactamase superfamily II)
MQIFVKPMGDYQTNCYILQIDGKEFVIDPGVGAINWIENNCKNLVAILNTHGHFDHIWSNEVVKNRFNIPLYAPKLDAFLLENDTKHMGMPTSKADYWVDNSELIDVDGIKFQFNHYAGHTPGSSTIEIGDIMFSGDFIFKGSIGRYDFPYSSASDMRNSLNRFLQRDDNKIIYPGHGASTSIDEERENLKRWLAYI